MTITHDEARELLTEHAAGELDHATDARVAGHLAGCDECRELLDTWSLLAAAAVAHPSIESLVAHAEGEPSTAVDEHLATCAACADQARAVREAAAEAAGTLPFRRRRPGVSRTVAVAGGAVAALLLVAVGWLALVRLPAAEERLASLRSRIGAERGAGATVALPLFRGALRGDETPATIEIGAGESLVPLALAPALPADLPDSTRLRLAVLAADGVTVYSSELEAGTIRRLVEASGVMAWLVPAALLDDGEATLRLDAGSGEPLLERRFVVRRAGEGNR